VHRTQHGGYHIVRAVPEDAAAIARVHVDGWRNAYQGILPAAFLDSLSYAQREDLWRGVVADLGGRHLFVAREVDGPVVGFGLGGRPTTRTPGYVGELDALYVRDGHQRRGVGTGLFRAVAGAFVEEGIGSMVAWVFSENPATRFYEHLGGEQVDRRAIEIAGQTVEELAYGWKDLLAQVLHREPV
jgi:GNAT superfamily N-acetyltransferase